MKFATPREEAAGINNRDPLRILTANRHLMRMALTGAVVLGVIGAVDTQDSSNSADKIKTGNLLRKISVIIFLVIACLLVVHTLFAMAAERRAAPCKPILPPDFPKILTVFEDEKSYGSSLGQLHGMKILLFTGLFLAVREAFYAVTLNNIPRQQEEKLFYPFAAGTELIAVLTFLIPGIVPPKHELPR